MADKEKQDKKAKGDAQKGGGKGGAPQKQQKQARKPKGGAAEAQADGATVGEVLEGLYSQHGELRERIAGDDGGLRRFVNVYLRGEDIRFLDGLATPVADGDEVTILPAVAGG